MRLRNGDSYQVYEEGMFTGLKEDSMKKRHDFKELKPLLLDYGEVAEEINLVGMLPFAEDQGQRGTCATFASCKIAEHLSGRNLSEQHLYNLAWHRYYDNTTKPIEEGTSIEVVGECLVSDGVVDSDVWFYDKNNMPQNLPQDPIPKRVQLAQKTKIKSVISYAVGGNKRFEKTVQIIGSFNIPIVISLDVYYGDSGFERGLAIDLPQIPNTSIAGKHAVVACGYNKKDRFIIIQNSWSLDWGILGTSLVTSDYINRFCDTVNVIQN